MESAARLCEADTVVIGRPKGEAFYFEAWYGFPAEYAEYMQVIQLKSTVDRYPGVFCLSAKSFMSSTFWPIPNTRIRARSFADCRTLLGVPLLREGSPIGVIALGRNSVRPFTDKQIELVTTFADQAVIAIENTRLFEAEQQRTRELTESLEQQTATSEVLRVIRALPAILSRCLQTMLENAVRICDANFGNIYRWDGDALHLLATHNTPPPSLKLRRHSAIRPIRTTPRSHGRDQNGGSRRRSCGRAGLH